MGKLVRISDAVGPRTFGTAPITERPSASAQSSPTPASLTIPRLDLAGMSRDALEAGVLPATTQFGMLELPTGAAVQRQNQREETAQRLDDQRKQETKTARSQLVNVNAQLRALEGNRTGDALTYIRGQDQWKALNDQKQALTLQILKSQETTKSPEDQRRQALEAERYQLTLPGRVYNEETTAQNRARVQEIDQELSMLKPERSGRLKSGVQSILSSTLGAPFAIGETTAQMGRNAAAQANDPEYQSLSERYSQIMGRMAGLEQSYKGHEDYLYATPQWNELTQERDEVLASLRQRGTELDKPVDVTSDGMRLMRESSQYREQALEGLEGVPRFLGSTALSIGQNAALLPLAAVNPAASLAAMSAVSSADRMYELSERGLPASEALGRGLISGGIEAATEKIPLENLSSVVRRGGTSAIRNIQRQAGIEAWEGSVSYMANYLADLAVQDPEAEFSLAELAQSAAGGALSGGVFGTGGTILNGLSNDYTFVPFSDLRITLPSRPGQKVVLPQGGERQSHIVEEAGPGGAETGGTILNGLSNDYTFVPFSDWIQKKKNPLVTTSDASVSTDPAHNAQSVPPSGSSGTIISKDGQEVNPENSGQMDRKRSSQQGIQIPVETRTWQDASNRKVNAFQYDHPELHPYYAEAAKVLQHELSQGTKGERFTLKDQDGYISGYTGSKRAQASPVEQALDNANLSYSDIDKALTAIINDQGQENYAAAKKMELVLDDMLSNGYTGADGMEYGPNESYLSARDAVNGGLPAESTEYRMGEEEWASLQASEPPESVYETGGQSDSLSVPTDEYIPNPGAGPQYLTGPESSVGGAREEFDPWSHFQNQRSQFIPEGANAARPVDVPTTDPHGRRIRRTASTAMGAKAIPDEAVADIQNMVLRGELSYNRVTDKASIDRAIKTIEEKTYAGALEEFRSAVSKGVVSKDIATLGQQLLINAANAGDEKITAEMLSLYAQMETTAGQAVQAASILRKLSPTSQLYAAQRTVSELEKTIQKSYKDLEITIDPALLEKFSQQTDQAGRDKVLEEIYQNVADQIPANWKDKWNAWRYLSMLFNPRTHIRNIAGNVFFLPVRMTKDRVAAAIEAGVSAASGGQFQRTKSFVASPELYKAAWSDWANVKDVLSGNKYDDVRSEINSRRRIFRTAPLEAIRTGNSWLLEFEDSIFKQITYADALAGYLQANGVTAEQVRNNTVDAQIMFSARDYAGKEALKATYQDRNRVSDKAVEISRTIGPVGDAILPFKRTPANVLVRGVEYSPVGLARGLKNALWDVKRGKMTGAEAIDRIASGLTGTGLFALGAALYSLGAVTSGGGDDENEDRLNDLIGKQNYALNLPGGVNVTLDWLAPAALPFFMGVELVDSLGRNGNTADSITSALKSISDPMLELSMLQSLNDVIDSVSFSENKLGALAASALISYFTQAIPTIGGQIERSAEPVRMSTYVDKNNPLFTDVQYALGRASARIPGYDFQQIPYIDAWGRDESSGPLILRTANSFINPSYTSITEVTPVDEEIRRLYNETGDGTVVPERPERTLTLDGGKINLTAEQYTKYATDRGQMRFSMLEDLFDRAEYAAMPATNRSAMVNDIYTFTDKVAKAEISDYVPDGWVEDVVDSGLDPVEYIIFRNMVSNISGEGKKDQIVAVIDSMDIPDAEKDRYYLTYGYSENTLGDTPWN